MHAEPDPLQSLLRRSAELHESIVGHLSQATVDDSWHTDLTLSTAQVALEHGISIAVLVETGHLSSANVLLRTQLEATIRAAWFLYVASDAWIDAYLMKARDNPMKDPGNAPGVDDMIGAIERKAAERLAPAGVAPQLRVFKEAAWGPLNSFVHSGIHPTILQQVGYSTENAAGTLRNANGLSIVAAMVIAALSGDASVAEGIKALQSAFLDCCPPPVAG